MTTPRPATLPCPHTTFSYARSSTQGPPTARRPTCMPSLCALGDTEPSPCLDQRAPLSAPPKEINVITLSCPIIITIKHAAPVAGGQPGTSVVATKVRHPTAASCSRAPMRRDAHYGERSVGWPQGSRTVVGWPTEALFCLSFWPGTGTTAPASSSSAHGAGVHGHGAVEQIRRKSSEPIGGRCQETRSRRLG